MATGTTKLTNMVNPEVMADMIGANLPSKIKFSPLAKIDRTLEGTAGDTITVPSYAFVGSAADLEEGVAMDTTVLTASTQTATVKQAGKAIELSDKAVLAGYGDPVGESERQLEMSIAAKIDEDCVTALASATLTHDISTTAIISYAAIVDAVDKFVEEDDEVKILFIHPNQKSQLRKDDDFMRASEMGDKVFMTGVIGEVAGCQVVASNKVPLVEGVYTNFIVKPNALAIYLKRDVQLESDRDILKKATVLSADALYAVALEDATKAVKLKVKSA